MAASPRFAPQPERFHRPELDVLRFGAFLLVFLHHALPHSAADGGRAVAVVARAGAFGVDLFFCLSAYLITELLLRETREKGTVDVRSFYLRRILRIWPLYFFALAGLVPALAWWDPAERLPASYLAAFALLSGNWACAIGGYPASSLALLWSVSIEEQFYLVWPWLVRARIERIRALAWGMLAVAWIARIVLLQVPHPGVWCNTFARLDPMAAGILLAGRSTQMAGSLRAIAMLGGLSGMLVAGAVGQLSGIGSLWTYPLIAASATAILRGTLGFAVDVPALGYLGKISFGLYVFHAAALRIAGSSLSGLGLTIVCAALSYRFLETPFLRWKERFARVASRPV